MEICKAILLGIIQGITEWLPVSSTGHMLLFDAFFPMHVSEACKNLFLVLVQLGSILAVVCLYGRTLNPLSPKKSQTEKRKAWLLWAKVLVASVPVGVVGILANDYVDEHLHSWQVVAGALFVYGVLFLILEKRNRKREFRITDIDDISFGDALKTGCFQALSLVPGTSRSGSTILGGMLVGLDRTVASTFSFFMAIIPMFGASLLKLVKAGFALQGQEWFIIAAGTLSAFLVSLISLRGLVSYVKKHDFSVFGWYRIILAVLVTVAFTCLL